MKYGILNPNWPELLISFLWTLYQSNSFVFYYYQTDIELQPPTGGVGSTETWFRHQPIQRWGQVWVSVPAWTLGLISLFIMWNRSFCSFWPIGSSTVVPIGESCIPFKSYRIHPSTTSSIRMLHFLFCEFFSDAERENDNGTLVNSKREVQKVKKGKMSKKWSVKL